MAELGSREEVVGTSCVYSFCGGVDGDKYWTGSCGDYYWEKVIRPNWAFSGSGIDGQTWGFRVALEL